MKLNSKDRKMLKELKKSFDFKWLAEYDGVTRFIYPYQISYLLIEEYGSKVHEQVIQQRMLKFNDNPVAVAMARSITDSEANHFHDRADPQNKVFVAVGVIEYLWEKELNGEMSEFQGAIRVIKGLNK